jgi:hypothetical protein
MVKIGTCGIGFLGMIRTRIQYPALPSPQGFSVKQITISVV